MKAKYLFASAGLLTGFVSTASLMACATDETAGGDTDSGSTTVVTPEASTDAGALDGGDASDDAAAAEPCVPDALCPGGPFDGSMAGGALDTRVRINILQGRAADDVWALGARGAVAHFDGTTWTHSDTGSFDTFNGLWLRDSGEIAIATLSSMYTRGMSLSLLDAGAPSADDWTSNGKPSGPTDVATSLGVVSSAWTAPGAEWLWMTTVETTVNGLWRLRVSPTTNRLEIGRAFTAATCAALPCRKMNGVHGLSADDVWAVGSRGAVFHITNAQGATPAIQPFDSQTWAELNAVWVASATDAWAVGGGGVMRHYSGQGSAWDVVDVPTTATLHAVWGSSASDVWAVGDDATVLHFDGKSWTPAKIAGLGARRPDLYSVWSSVPGHVWIGGDGVVLSVGGKP